VPCYRTSTSSVSDGYCNATQIPHHSVHLHVAIWWGQKTDNVLTHICYDFYLWVLHPVAFLSDSLWHRQSRQSFSRLTPFIFSFVRGWPVRAETCSE
jgi:hypothetical protein